MAVNQGYNTILPVGGDAPKHPPLQYRNINVLHRPGVGNRPNPIVGALRCNITANQVDHIMLTKWS